MIEWPGLTGPFPFLPVSESDAQMNAKHPKEDPRKVAERVRRYRQKHRKEGDVRLEVHLKKADAETLRELAKEYELSMNKTASWLIRVYAEKELEKRRNTKSGGR